MRVNVDKSTSNRVEQTSHFYPSRDTVIKLQSYPALSIYVQDGAQYAIFKNHDTDDTLSIDWIQSTNIKGLAFQLRQNTKAFCGKAEKDYLDSIKVEDLEKELGKLSVDSTLGNSFFGEDIIPLKEKPNNRDLNLLQLLRPVAESGFSLYDASFPAGSELRRAIDNLSPGSMIEITWWPTGGNWMQIPWGLMYRVNPSDENKIDPLNFLSFRYRIKYLDYKQKKPFPARLGSIKKLNQFHCFTWAERQYLEGKEALWQRKKIMNLYGDNCFCKPDLLKSQQEFKEEIKNVFRAPDPPPVGILYAYCHAKSQAGGSNVILRFGNPNEPDTSQSCISLNDISYSEFEDSPLAFINACQTLWSQDSMRNSLEQKLFNRGVSAYIGTETEVPIIF
ncbi:MAG: hypothetical protein AAFY41_14770, partial [Bacteroidota bacterium]